MGDNHGVIGSTGQTYQTYSQIISNPIITPTNHHTQKGHIVQT